MAYRGGAVGASGSSTQTVTVSGIGIALNDIVLLCLCDFMGNTPTWPSGFAQVPGTSPAVNDGNTAVYTYYKVATASEPISYSVTGVAFGGALTCRVYSGRNTSSPFTNSHQTAAGTAASFPLSFSITGLTANSGDDVVVFVGEQPGGATTPATYSYTPSSGFANGLLANDTVDSNAQWIASSDLVNTVGATGTIAGSLSVTSGAGPGVCGYLAQVISLAQLPGLPTVVQSAFNNGGSWPTSTSVTLNGVTAGNAILIVTPAVNNTSGSPSLVITDSVNVVAELKQIASFGLSSVFSLLDFSLIQSATAGSHTLTATIGSGTGFGCILAIEIAGLNSGAVLDVFSLNAAGGGSNPTTGSSGTPASVTEIAVAAVSGYENGTALTIGSPAGYTNIAKFQAGTGFVQCSVDYLTPVALTAQSATWTGMTAVNSYAAGVIVLKAAANQATVMWWT